MTTGWCDVRRAVAAVGQGRAEWPWRCACNADKSDPFASLGGRQANDGRTADVGLSRLADLQRE